MHIKVIHKIRSYLKTSHFLYWVVHTNEADDACRSTGWLQEAKYHANSVQSNVFCEASPHKSYRI